MSSSRHAAAPAIVTGRLDLGAGTWFAKHDHDAHQLAWATQGVLMVRSAERTWVLPPGLALWIPRGTPHATGAATAAAMLGVYLDPERCPIEWDEPTVVGIDDLVRALLTHLLDGLFSPAATAHAEALLFEQLRPAPDLHLAVPVPADQRARSVAQAVLDRPAEGRSLAAHARASGASARTLARIWSVETGFGFARWRTRVRVEAALPMLAAGVAVSRVAQRVGYATPSAFVAAFRREVGVSPGEYYAGS